MPSRELASLEPISALPSRPSSGWPRSGAPTPYCEYLEGKSSLSSVQWDPPVKPNGEITHYIVIYKQHGLDPFKYIDDFGDGCYEGLLGSRPPDQRLPSDTDGRAREITEDDPTPLSPAQQTLLSTIAPPDTCAANGCCACPVNPMSTSQQRQETSDFENALQDTIFVQK